MWKIVFRGFRRANSDPTKEDTSSNNCKNASTEKCLSPGESPYKSPRRSSNLLQVNDDANKNGQDEERKCTRVVKNLNEFLNFANLNRSKVTSKIESELRRVASEGSASQASRDENSPDDPADFYPMTTSMTRELRLELESLDRQVKFFKII